MDAIKQSQLTVFHVLCVSLVFGLIALNTNEWMKTTEPSELKVTPKIEENYNHKRDYSDARMGDRNNGRNYDHIDERVKEESDEKVKYYSNNRIKVKTGEYTREHNEHSSIREPLLWWQQFTAFFLYAALFLSTIHAILLMVLLTRPECPNIMLLANVVLCGLIFLCYLCAVMFFGIGIACVRKGGYAEESFQETLNGEIEELDAKELGGDVNKYLQMERALQDKFTPEKLAEKRRQRHKRLIEEFEAAPGMSYWMVMYAMLAALGATLTAGSAFMSNKDAAN